MTKVVTIALQHPTEPDIYLHGLRSDNHRWAMPGGHVKPGETADEAAARELEEETGVKGIKLEHAHQQHYGDLDVHLYIAQYPGTELTADDDPDKEFVTFKFLNPLSHGNMHIPARRNILAQWMDRDVKTHSLLEPTKKSAGKIKVEPFVVDPKSFDPRKHDFIVRTMHKGKPIGILAVTHTKAGLMPFNFEVNRMYRRKGYGTAMANHAEKISGKKIVRSPDMTSDAVSWANTFIGPDKLKKSKQVKVAVVALYDKNFIMVGRRRKNDKWALPGGRFEDDESKEDVVIRELKEEAGIRLKKENLHFAGTRDIKDKKVYVFLAPYPGGEPTTDNDPDEEFSEWQWIRCDEGKAPDWIFDEELNPPTQAAFDKLNLSKREGLYKMGMLGDWKKEGYTLSHKITPHHTFEDENNLHVYAHAPDGSVAGHVQFQYGNGGRTLMSESTAVHPDHRRKGLASAMYQYAQQLSGAKIRPSDTRTNESIALWNQPNRQFGKSELFKKDNTIGGALSVDGPATLMNRVEDKYFIRRTELDLVTSALKEKLHDGDPDTAVRFNVNKTIYLDNRDLDALRDNMESRRPRFKVRIRQYSPTGDQWEDVAYVELKIKPKDGVTKKVRVRIPASMIDQISEGSIIRVDEALEKLNVDTTRDVLWRRVAVINTVLEKYGFRKQVVVSYQRRAYSGGKIRVTIDDSIRFCDAREIPPDIMDLVTESKYFKSWYKCHTKIRKDDYLILEVKHEDDTPIWLKDLLKNAGAKSVSFSKYCGAMAAYMSSGKDNGEITVDRKIDASSVLADIEGYDVIGKTETAMPTTSLYYPVTIGDKGRSNLMIKDFGQSAEPMHETIEQIGDQHKLDHPIDERNMIFVPHKLKNLKGDVEHVLEVQGAPPKIDEIRMALLDVGPKSSRASLHIPISESDFERLSRMGSALTADQVGIKLHPAELRHGGTVIRTW